jgi:hypothetical protein
MTKRKHEDDFTVNRRLIPGYYGENDPPRYTYWVQHKGYRPQEGPYKTRKEALRVGSHQQVAARYLGWTRRSVESPPQFMRRIAREDRARFTEAVNRAMEEAR